jgi:chromosome segregation ATPase
MSRRHVLAAAILLAGSFAVARSVEAQKMYKWTDKDGKVHFSNVAPQGEEKEEASPGVQGIEAQSPQAPSPSAESSAPAEAPAASAGTAETAKSEISEEQFSSRASATRTRLKRELAKAKEESQAAQEKLEALQKERNQPARVGLEMLQKAYGPDQHESSEEEDLRKRKEKADARIEAIRKEYADLHDEAVKRLGHQPSWWLPLD